LLGGKEVVFGGSGAGGSLAAFDAVCSNDRLVVDDLSLEFADTDHPQNLVGAFAKRPASVADGGQFRLPRRGFSSDGVDQDLNLRFLLVTAAIEHVYF
jgi:hypothetical protein